MDITQCTTHLKQFRLKLYQNINKRADTFLDLVDALCSNMTAQSVVELSQSSCFQRSYSTLYKAVTEVKIDRLLVAHLLQPALPRPQQRPFWLFIVDATSLPRLYGQTVADRGMVYAPTVVSGNKPVTIGHQYSTVALGLEPEAGYTSGWVLPLLTQRVTTSQDKELVGADQIKALLDDPQLPFGQDLCVEVADSSYSKPAYLHRQRRHPNLVTITRLKGNRTLFHQLDRTPDEGNRVGHPTWYGAAFNLAQPADQPAPSQTFSCWQTSPAGKRYQIKVEAWSNMLMRGKRSPELIPMHQYPFTLVRITRYNEAGQPVFKRPLWLLVMGPRRGELSLEQIYRAYTTRFDLEHFFRFGKQKLLLTRFQTPVVEREETWWQLCHLAYAQLWLARPLVVMLPRPWERHLPHFKNQRISPALVQRDFGRIARQIGTPARPPKPRHNSAGRAKGTKLPPRPRQAVVVKGKSKVCSP